MTVFRGKKISDGRACGVIRIIRSGDATAESDTNGETAYGRNSADEEKLLEEALSACEADLAEMRKRTEASMGASAGEIFDAHIMLLRDEGFLEEVRSRINDACMDNCPDQDRKSAKKVTESAGNVTESAENVPVSASENNARMTAVSAVKQVRDIYVERFSNLPDEMMRARALDIKDVADRLMKKLSVLAGGTGSENGTHRRPETVEGNPSEGGANRQAAAAEDRQPGTGAGKGSLKNTILVSDDMTPGELMELEGGRPAGLVLLHGSALSHTAILAGMMGIPMLVDITQKTSKEIPETPEIPGTDRNTSESDNSEGVRHIDMTDVIKYDGYYGIINTDSNELIIDIDLEHFPKTFRGGETLVDIMQDDEADKEAENIRMSENMNPDKEAENIHLPGNMNPDKEAENIHLPGNMKLYANISTPGEVSAAIASGAAGIGLFRSEFLYMGRSLAPSEEEQFAAYRKAAEYAAGRPVIIRTADLGADKEVPYIDFGTGESYRGIRVSLDHAGMFRTQLRAILRAAAYGNVSVMYPMIMSDDEFMRASEQLALASEELRQNGFREKDGKEYASEDGYFAIPAQGVMIETPEAVMVSGKLAEHADFFSIGTNDLTRLVTGIDRLDTRANGLADTLTDDVGRLIGLTAKAAHRAGIQVEVCGEMAADPDVCEKLAGLGVDGISVSAGRMYGLKSRFSKKA